MRAAPADLQAQLVALGYPVVSVSVSLRTGLVERVDLVDSETPERVAEALAVAATLAPRTPEPVADKVARAKDRARERVVLLEAIAAETDPDVRTELQAELDRVRSSVGPP